MPPQTPIYSSRQQSRLPLIAVSLLFIMALIFGFWAFAKMQDYKNNSDKKSAAAVATADKQLTTQLQAQYAQQAKQPYATYTSAATYGGITFNYPKNWSIYDASSSDEPINAYFYSGTIPSTDSGATYPLRVELVSTDYADVVQQFSGSNTDVSASAYMPPKLKNVANIQPGTKFDGQIGQGDNGSSINGSMLVIKVRDKTLEIYTQSADEVSDFNNIILSSLSFAP